MEHKTSLPHGTGSALRVQTAIWSIARRLRGEAAGIGGRHDETIL